MLVRLHTCDLHDVDGRQGTTIVPYAHFCQTVTHLKQTT